MRPPIHMSTTTPKNWPKGVTYITTPSPSPALSKSQSLIELNTPPIGTNVIPLPPSPSSLVHIKPITSATHPANGQYGLFAAKPLKPSTLVILYVGYLHTAEESDPSSSYDLSVDAESGVGIDATHMGNEARFINDYRGVAERPNAEFKDVWIQAGKNIVRGIGVFVLSGKGREKGIKKGDEILVSYGKGFWNARKMNE